MGNKKGGEHEMSSRTIFFFHRCNRKDRSSFKGCTLLQRVLALEGYDIPSLSPLARSLSFLPDATCPTVFGSRVTKDAEIQKSRRARDQKSEARGPFSWGYAGIVNGPAESTTSSSFLAMVLLRQDPFLRALRLRSSLPRMYRGP